MIYLLIIIIIPLYGTDLSNYNYRKYIIIQ